MKCFIILIWNACAFSNIISNFSLYIYRAHEIKSIQILLLYTCTHALKRARANSFHFNQFNANWFNSIQFNPIQSYSIQFDLILYFSLLLDDIFFFFMKITSGFTFYFCYFCNLVWILIFARKLKNMVIIFPMFYHFNLKRVCDQQCYQTFLYESMRAFWKYKTLWKISWKFLLDLISKIFSWKQILLQCAI